MKKISILGVNINNLSFADILLKIDEFIYSMSPNLIVTPNAEIIVSATKDDDIKNILNSASISIPDSIGVILAGKYLKTPFKERIPGIDLMMEILKQATSKKYGIYLLGASPAVIQTAAKNINKKYPDLRILGTMHGYFKNDEEQEVLDDILDANPDILFVGMGSPYQEKWAIKHLHKLRVPVIMCVGGSFDVISGYLKRAPKWMQKIGLEWLYRFMQQPSRLKRILVLPFFIYLLIKKQMFVSKYTK